MSPPGAAETMIVLGAVAVILAAAKISGHIATRLAQPAVLGELIAGVVLGNLGLIGLHWAEPFKTNTSLQTL